jgi:hypothetical protein
MSYKVVRDADENVICFGPNDDNYDPVIATGQVLHVEDSKPTDYIAELQKQEKTKAAARQAVLDKLGDKLGLTADEAAALLG